MPAVMAWISAVLRSTSKALAFSASSDSRKVPMLSVYASCRAEKAEQSDGDDGMLQRQR